MFDDKQETEPDSSTATVKLTKTSCGDNHNIGLDSEGKAYSLPSPLDFDPFPNGTHKVTDIQCGKEHCLLLTEHGQGADFYPGDEIYFITYLKLSFCSIFVGWRLTRSIRPWCPKQRRKASFSISIRRHEN